MDKSLSKSLVRIKKAALALGLLKASGRNSLLADMSAIITRSSKQILRANRRDLNLLAEEDPMYDRLLLNTKRIREMAAQIKEVAALPDILGKVFYRKKQANGLAVEKVRVPLGVVAIIYEARPNVTTDVASLCFKTGNAVVLRGGHEAYHTNLLLVNLLKKALKKNNLSPDLIGLVDPKRRELVKEVLKADHLIDVVLARGGQGLVEFVKKNATVPFIETGAGVCHTYVEKTADPKKAAKIIFNAKTQRPSVCNALDTLVVDREIIKEFLPKAASWLKKKAVLLKADPESYTILKKIYPPHLLQRATDKDFGREFLSLILSVKTVGNFTAAIKFIQRNSSGHSEAILTKNKKLGHRFQALIEAAAVYINTSTRFTDGNQFGLGAELGISTQKLHARGPMGLLELTSYKWLGESDWLIRQ